LSTQECSVDGGLDAIHAAVSAAGSCRAASAVAKRCALGAGGDVALAGAVSEICEKDFLANLDRRDVAAYAKSRSACLAKYRHLTGSMYRSSEAFCQAGISERFSDRALRRRAVR
jgi:hypothetical protein